ncbi:MAG: class I SAM-dependent methyltransferase [Myxococcota bacterium]|nr:class I SAM-dependent methyltransferase [Myxococcota bacterium]
MLDTLVRPARRAAYQAQQASFRLSLVAAHTVLRAVAGDRETPETDAFEALREQYEGLLERDVRNAEEGLYPASLLFQMPLFEYALALPRFLLDVPRSFRRARRNEFRDLPKEANPRSYPAYFRRNFHWQTDGYLSRRSADIYDVSVEFLFMGCADVMRRQVIPPMTRFARQQKRRPLRILDVACGTGRTLSQIATALPDSQLFGVDLSPYYLESARERLADVPNVSLVSENAEKLPYRDGYFDIVTSTYLFHELPRKARRTVVNELHRVLRPGGLLVIEDSAQLEEATDLTPFLEGFATQMHEPFYRDYIRDDLSGLVAECGFSVEGSQRAWLAKVVRARKPSGNGRA